MRKISPRTQFIIAIALAAIGSAVQFLKSPENPDALWQIVSTKCVPNQIQHGDPSPCAVVHPNSYAVLKDRHGRSQYLLIPTDRIAGIEAPVLTNPKSFDYFAAAWEARHFVEDALKKKLPRQEIALAINSQKGRTQNQFHIHIDCIRRDVRGALQKYQGKITPEWTDFPVPLAFHHYRARRVDGETWIGVDNPFTLLAQDPAAGADMGDETLAMVGANFEGGKPGFILLADRADPAADDFASAGELLDHSCLVAREAGR